MRTPSLILVAAGLATLAGCTVKNTEAPPLAGPSTLAMSLAILAQPDSIIQDGSTSAITATALDHLGRPVPNVDLRAEIFLGDVAQDFGTLVPRTLRTGSNGVARFVYTAPPRPAESVGTGTRVTIAITPVGSDFRGSARRQVDINVIPPGVILPPNGAPVPSFVVTPTPAITRKLLSFDATATIDEGVPCGTRCTYSWNFGDNTTGSGLTTTHEYRTPATYTVVLTVTDERGTSATATQTLVVGATAAPTAVFRMSPTPVGANQDVFFNASESVAAAGRQIVGYGWNFGDGRTASGVTVARSFAQNGTYQIVLTVTDDSDAVGRATQSLVVTSTGSGPTAVLTFSPQTPITTATTVFFNASASTPGTAPIVEYKFNYGDGSAGDVQSSPLSNHRFTAAGTYVVRLTVTDSLGRTGTQTVNVVVT